MPARFGIGDEVTLRGTVRLIDAAGDGTVTIELHGTGQRVTVMASSTYASRCPSGKSAMSPADALASHGRGFAAAVRALALCSATRGGSAAGCRSAVVELVATRPQ